ncbi:hypothetical protein L798_05274 [Zootermopsis nevadensis]|uniref:Uncharacterized protein n=1 Tax=Zootermopsis nevadensis TaxID=136037 RepID=A0A067QF06_ZOONE|nr:hypothetical protein L798_05274 [Zootermopsis nevadensis]
MFMKSRMMCECKRHCFGFGLKFCTQHWTSSSFGSLGLSADVVTPSIATLSRRKQAKPRAVKISVRKIWQQKWLYFA